MKTKIMLLVLGVLFLSNSKAQDSSYFYLNGAPFYLHMQKDLCSYRLIDKSESTLTFDPSIVDTVVYYGESDGIHILYFTPMATDIQKVNCASLLMGEPLFEKFFFIGAKEEYKDYPANEKNWMATDMQLTMTFNDPDISLADVEALAAEYELNIIFEKNGIPGHEVYVMEVDRKISYLPYDSPTLTMDIAKLIWENENDIIQKVTPSVRIFHPDIPDDEFYDDQWWMRDGVVTTCNGTEVTPNASIDLDCAQNFEFEYNDGPSYSGEGVVVGIIDFHGVQWSHPDCDSLFLDGWIAFDSSTVIPINSDGSDVYHVAWNEAHLQNVSGVIGANIDNGIGSAGVAYGSKIIPCLHTGTTGQFNALLLTLFDEFDDRQTDIINMSFGFGGMSVADALGFPFSNALNICDEFGRDEKGIVLVASAGNSNGEVINIPAALPMVFSVAATNPLDQLKSSGDGYDPVAYTWGSSYFNNLDVAAPDICITSTDYSDPGVTGFPPFEGGGYSDQEYHSFSGTSASAPIVCGIAALLLEKDGGLSNGQVYDAIRFSAEKVGGYTYTSFSPSGRCLELGYGRVNACDALNILDQLTIEENENSFAVTHLNPVTNALQVTIDGISTNYSVRLYSLTGELVYEMDVQNQNSFSLDMQSFSNGLYYLNIVDSESQESITSKVVKQ